MTALAICLLVMVLLVGILFVMTATRLNREPQVVVQHVPPPAPPSAPPAAVKRIQINLVSASGRPLGTVQIDPKFRKPIFRYRTKTDNCMSMFVADHETQGVWTYRRVGVERE